MTLLAGIDLSTRQLDAALIPLDEDARGVPPVTFRSAPLRNANPIDIADRLRSVRDAMRYLLHPVPHPRPDPDWILQPNFDVVTPWIEQPRGPHAVAPLNQIFGAAIASVPTRCTVASIDPQEWRRTLGLPTRLPKSEAIFEAETLLWHHFDREDALTEHQAEALLVALAGRDLCWKAAA